MTIYAGENSTVEYGTPEYEAAKAELVAKVSAFEAALQEAISVADEYGLEFSISPAYGMGGSYVGQGSSEEERGDDATTWDLGDWGWYASSQSC